MRKQSHHKVYLVPELFITSQFFISVKMSFFFFFADVQSLFLTLETEVEKTFLAAVLLC